MADLTILRPTERDEDGNRGEDTVAGTLTGCAVAPRTTADASLRASDTSREELDVFCPDIDADVSTSDRVEYAGNVYEVDGLPQRWVNPFTGARPGCVIQISRQVG